MNCAIVNGSLNKWGVRARTHPFHLCTNISRRNKWKREKKNKNKIIEINVSEIIIIIMKQYSLNENRFIPLEFRFAAKKITNNNNNGNRTVPESSDQISPEIDIELCVSLKKAVFK